MFGIGASIKAIVALIIVAVVAGGLWYVSEIKADLVVERNNTEKLKEGIRDQQALMDQMRQDVAQIQQINRDLQDAAAKYRADVEALRDKFSQDARGNPRDFSQFAAEKPELVQGLVNRAVKNVMRCLEIASGAPRTAQEIAAKNASEINKECPAIANPNYRAAQ